jgi:flagellar hook-basal body complex protein FliE
MAGVINPAALNAYARAAKIGGGEGMSAGDTTSFGDVLGGVLKNAVENGKTAEIKAAGLVQGKGDLVDVVSAVNAAEMSLETVVAIRDKVIAAYQDILRMPI